MSNQAVVVNAAKPRDTAASFKSARFPTLINQQDEWLVWRGGAYESVEEATVRSEVSEYLANAKTMMTEEREDGSLKKEFKAFNPKARDINEVVTALKNLCHVPRDRMSPPCWLKGTPAEYKSLDPGSLISLKNGLLDITTRELYEPTSFFFTRTVLPIEYDLNANAPERWLSFLGEVFQDRQSSIGLLQEWFGYKISSDTSQHRVMFLYGRPRAGKGTILRIENALVGERNATSPTTRTVGGKFGLQGLMGKSSAQITDMDTSNREHLSAAASQINAISGEDRVSIERKGITSWDGTLAVRFTLAGNTLPNFGSHTNAMLTRLLVLPFEVTFEGVEDRSLTEKLKAELPGILNWCLDGLDRLRQRGNFDEPPESKQAKQRLRYRSDPIHGFVAERCLVKAQTGTDKAVLYAAYCDYCEETGSHPVALHNFTPKLEELFPGVQTGKRRTGSGTTKIPCYRGIRINDDHAAKVYKPDREMAELMGYDCYEALATDAGGWPIPRASNGMPGI
jgi:putative DNA primase/helicase